jgi:hypothetical protein
MTRAQDKLILTYKRKNKDRVTGMSPFLLEMDNSGGSSLEAFDSKGRSVSWDALKASSQHRRVMELPLPLAAATAGSSLHHVQGDTPQRLGSRQLCLRKRAIAKSPSTHEEDPPPPCPRRLKTQPDRLDIQEGGCFTTPVLKQRQHAGRPADGGASPVKIGKHFGGSLGIQFAHA